VRKRRPVPALAPARTGRLPASTTSFRCHDRGGCRAYACQQRLKMRVGAACYGLTIRDESPQRRQRATLLFRRDRIKEGVKLTKHLAVHDSPPLPDDIQSPVCTTHVTCQYTCLSAAGGEEAHHEEALTHRQLGSAGVRVSVIGLGTNRFGAATVPRA
jgi:hypothetical protein